MFFRRVNCFFACRRNRSFLFLPFNNLSCLSAYLMPCFVKDAVSILAGRIFCIPYRIILSITLISLWTWRVFILRSIAFLHLNLYLAFMISFFFAHLWQFPAVFWILYADCFIKIWCITAIKHLVWSRQTFFFLLHVSIPQVECQSGQSC